MSLTLTHHPEALRLREPFRISGYLFEAMPGVVAQVGDGTHVGRGEAAGVYYLDDDPAHMQAEIERCRPEVERGITREELRSVLPAGGARNALDCALWELESLRAGTPVWRLAGVPSPRPLVTTFTISADEPAAVERQLRGFASARAIKIKLAGELEADIERVRVVRTARPDVWIGVDANQGFGARELEPLAAALVELGVSVLEQPVPRGQEALLDGWRAPLPLVADESILDGKELIAQHARFDVVNIKLDKCGGLTEALAMARKARELGLQVMVGNMAGSTLAAAPAYVLAQLCDIVDLDGPSFLADDPAAAGIYSDGYIAIPDGLWGSG